MGNGILRVIFYYKAGRRVQVVWFRHVRQCFWIHFLYDHWTSRSTRICRCGLFNGGYSSNAIGTLFQTTSHRSRNGYLVLAFCGRGMVGTIRLVLCVNCIVFQRLAMAYSAPFCKGALLCGFLTYSIWLRPFDLGSLSEINNF